MRLSEEERNLLHLFVEDLQDDGEMIDHDQADAFIHRFNADPATYRAEIAPARQEAIDQRDAEGGEG